MKKILSIYDVSSFIHAGHVNKRAFLERLVQKDIPGQPCKWATQYTLAGGTAFVLKAAILGAQRGDVVFCCDRNPTIKKSMLPGYKSNRNHPDSIENDKKLAEFVLKHCGACVLASAGYEADDIITTLVHNFHDRYDAIHVYTGDSDLYFLVDDLVTIKPSSSRAKEVTMENFSTAFKRGVTIPYNYAIPYKILYGDASDCIPPLSECYRERFIELTTMGRYPSVLGRKDVLTHLMTDFCPWAKESLDLIYPLTVEGLPEEFSVPDVQMMINWADTMHCGEYSGMAAYEFNPEPLIEEVQRMGLYEED